MTKKDANDSTTPTPAESTTDARSALTYSEPVKVEGGVKVRASDGKGNSLSVVAKDEKEAKAALLAQYKNLQS
ncbi:hypothetical protein [Deinococcus hopiensis]|uniref:Uncharacterized protein n=1 Tax=Deinococcus hopiensis KR-140 TaxID=695939 RepID=A0A1W1UXG9_9DEIO|nr:hypothetical protein [Deinococcus hopiensis]SMB85783.1 hypothetical protein SAMN00790413_03541 [Deinococcus hopiensis KR-140]